MLVKLTLQLHCTLTTVQTLHIIQIMSVISTEWQLRPQDFILTLPGESDHTCAPLFYVTDIAGKNNLLFSIMLLHTGYCDIQI